ncbi:MAG: lysoplasmalogenase family protein [Oscillospiraceae bacterium]|nr:lysoplasmalogenase family protein [Oscillospiraceae bacterium]
MLVYIFCLVCGLASLVWFLKLRVKKSTTKAAMAKSFVSVFFMGTALAAIGMSDAKENLSFGLLVVAGLLFGLLGDIWLDLKFVYQGENDTYTFAGFYAFAVGHVLFIIGLLTNYADFSQIGYVIVPIVVAAAVGVGNVFLGPVMKLNYGKYKRITMIYGSILFGMTLLSGSLALLYSFSEMTLNLMFVGGVFFLISDLILSGTYFGEGKNRPIDVITNHVTYYIAQFIIASSLIFLK